MLIKQQRVEGEAVVSERHRAAGRLGGLAVVRRYGREWMQTIGRRGGRPTWQATLARAWQQHPDGVREAWSQMRRR